MVASISEEGDYLSYSRRGPIRCFKSIRRSYFLLVGAYPICWWAPKERGDRTIGSGTSETDKVRMRSREKASLQDRRRVKKERRVYN